MPSLLLGLVPGSQEALLVDRKLAERLGLLVDDGPVYGEVEDLPPRPEEPWDAPLAPAADDPFRKVPEELLKL